MEIIAQGSGYMLCLSYSELNQNYITKDYAQKLIASALHLSPVPDSTTIELFEGRDSALIFVKLPKFLYRFDTFEEVITACKCCSADTAALYYYDDEYILSVSSPDAAFTEFVDPEVSCDLYELFLQEHGKVIINDNAVNFVKNTF